VIPPDLLGERPQWSSGRWRPPYNRGVPSEAHRIREPDLRARSAGARVVHAWGALDRDRRLAAIAAVALFATMLLPWYQQNAVVRASRTEQLVSRNLNAFAVFSFVEAAVLLVAVAVLSLLFARAEGRSFQLPGGDGTVVFAAGLWTALLLVLRLFDKPGITRNGVAANVGIQWGIFFALAAAGLLAYAGSRMRSGRRPEPPLVREPRPRRRPEPSPRPESSPRREPSHRPEPPPSDEEITIVTNRPEPAGGRPRPRHPPAPAGRTARRADPSPGAEQLSFEDPQQSAE
jgi:hypothetical protein